MNETNVIAAPEPVAEAPPGLTERARVVPYPAIERHGIIGDRRTAALVAADGTLDWLCLPDFDSAPVFGALLDWSKGGHWRLGPARMATGAQHYLENSAVLETRWELSEGTLVLHDAMLWPEGRRPPEQTGVRVVVRALRCERGTVRCQLGFQPGCRFQQNPATITAHSTGYTIQLPEFSLRLWTSRPLTAEQSRLRQVFELKQGEELWTVLECGAAGHGWTVESARGAMEKTRGYWQDWVGALRPGSIGEKEIRRAAMMVHLLTYAPEGSAVAAPTTSVPERIGGDWNADYRFCWVRDASLAVSILARLGNLQETRQYLHWLVQRLSRFGAPLQVLYDIRGSKRPGQKNLSNVAGYRESQPVRTGNHAYKQHQLGSYGYLADCVWTYLNEGGQWREEYWKLIVRVAKHTIKHWQDPENGIWELPERRHYLNSKVLSWVTLDRAIRIAQKVDVSFDTSEWQTTRETIHAEVMEKGWSERLGAFRQHYDGDDLDAAALLIPVLEFLPADHPRVLATLERISESLTIDDFVFRFDPMQTPCLGQLPLGELEGAFFPSTFWLATTYAKAGHLERAERILERAEKLAGPAGLFSEAADPRTRTLLGNTPLLFSLAEYVRAMLEIARGKPDK